MNGFFGRIVLVRSVVTNGNSYSLWPEIWIQDFWKITLLDYHSEVSRSFIVSWYLRGNHDKNFILSQVFTKDSLTHELVQIANKHYCSFCFQILLFDPFDSVTAWVWWRSIRGSHATSTYEFHQWISHLVWMELNFNYSLVLFVESFHHKTSSKDFPRKNLFLINNTSKTSSLGTRISCQQKWILGSASHSWVMSYLFEACFQIDNPFRESFNSFVSLPGKRSMILEVSDQILNWLLQLLHFTKVWVRRSSEILNKGWITGFGNSFTHLNHLEK